MRLRVVVMLDGHSDVHHAQETEHHGLNQAHDNAQAQERYGDADGGELDEHEYGFVVADHITGQAQSQAHRSRQVADDLDDEDQRCQENHGPHHMLDVYRSL